VICDVVESRLVRILPIVERVPSSLGSMDVQREVSLQTNVPEESITCGQGVLPMLRCRFRICRFDSNHFGFREAIFSQLNFGAGPWPYTADDHRRLLVVRTGDDLIQFSIVKDVL
jgi:hypothetical protein